MTTNTHLTSLETIWADAAPRALAYAVAQWKSHRVKRWTTEEWVAGINMLGSGGFTIQQLEATSHEEFHVAAGMFGGPENMARNLTSVVNIFNLNYKEKQ